MVVHYNSLKWSLLSQKGYMISFITPRNRVLDTGIKKEPYRYRILDTRFYTISCILYSTRATRVWLIYHFDFEHLDKYKQVIEIKNVV